MSSRWPYHVMAYKYCIVPWQKRYGTAPRSFWFLDDFLNTVIFPESLELTDELDFNAVFSSHTPGICSDPVGQGVGDIRKIKNTDVVGFQMAGDAVGMDLSGNISPDDYTVITGNRTVNFVSIFIRK